MIDPATMSDSVLSARLADEQRRAPEVRAAAEHANRQLAENTAAIKALTAEAAFRATLKELRRKSSAARVEVLRALATTEKFLDVDGPTTWLLSRRLTRQHRSGIGSRSYALTDLGRRALTLLESA